MSAKHKPFGMTTPCAQCPFRNDIPPYLTPGRVREIELSLVRSDFPCHKTTIFNENGEHISNSAQEIHCAGALILLEKLHRPSQMMRIAERLGLYDPTKLDMRAPVFDSFKKMIAAQRKG
jgi:hypothetical protein